MVFVTPNFIPEYRAARKHSIASTNGWWLNRWPLLGWLETFVKIAAWCFVPNAINKNFTRTAGTLSFEQMPAPFVVEIAIMLIASALIAVAIVDRFIYREVISIIFVFPNNWAHWTLTITMLRYGPDAINSRYLRIFCWLMLAGDVIKLIFFAVHDFTRLNIARYVIYVLVFAFAVMYSLVLVLDYGYVTPAFLSPVHSAALTIFGLFEPLISRF